MNRIIDYQNILETNSSIKSSGNHFYTNFYLSKAGVEELILDGRIYYLSNSNTILFFIDEGSFFRLYYSTNTSNFLDSFDAELQEVSKPIVIDILTKKENEDLENFIKNKFILHKVFRRMASNKLLKKDEFGQTKIASLDDKDEIEKALTGEFDIFAEHLPKKEELEIAVRQGSVVIDKENDEIAALLMFEKIGVTSTLRYWYVNANYRGCGHGSKVFQSYVAICDNVKRFLLWVDENNTNVIEKYNHFGYSFDGLIDYILVRK